MTSQWFTSILLIVSLAMIAGCNLDNNAQTGLSDNAYIATENEASKPEDTSLMTTPSSLIATPTMTIVHSIALPIAQQQGCIPRKDWTIYTVINGDTLSGIAGRTGSTIAALGTANCLKNLDFIRAGQQLRIPRLPQ